MHIEAYHNIALESFETEKDVYLFELAYEEKWDSLDSESFISDFFDLREDTSRFHLTYRDFRQTLNRDRYVLYPKTLGEMGQEVELKEIQFAASIERMRIKYVEEVFPALFPLSSFLELMISASCYYCGISEKDFSFLKRFSLPYRSFYATKQSLRISRKEKHQAHKPENTLLTCLVCDQQKGDEFSVEDFQLIGKSLQQLWQTKLKQLSEHIGSKELSLKLEEEIKRAHDTSMNPREWMARNGYRILCGDLRRYAFRDKEFEKWIHQAYDARFIEGEGKLWDEFLTQAEIADILRKRDRLWGVNSKEI